jgi:RNA polymerase sigma factor (sigma-70 family)
VYHVVQIAPSSVSEAMGVTFDDFAKDAMEQLSPAFVAAFGFDRGQDALGEAMAYAAANRERIVSLDKPLGYLWKVGETRTARRRPRARPFPPPAEVDMPAIEPGLPVALERLTEPQRVCVVLIHAFGWTYQDVADLLGISRGSVQNHAARALAHLQQTIGAEHD